jgi:hypothetical protein
MARAEPGVWEQVDVWEEVAKMTSSLPVWLAAHPPDESEWALVQEPLRATLPESQRVALFFRHAYAEVRERLRRDQEFRSWSRENPLLTAWSLKPNRTLGALRMDLEPAILALDEGWPAAAAVVDQLNYGTSPELPIPNPPGWRGNALGERMRASALHQTMILVPVMLEQWHQHRLAIVQVAIRRFELATGRLPSALEELVPHYLESIPVNQATGLLWQWDAGRKHLHNSPADQTRSSKSPTRASMAPARYWWELSPRHTETAARSQGSCYSASSLAFANPGTRASQTRWDSRSSAIQNPVPSRVTARNQSS